MCPLFRSWGCLRAPRALGAWQAVDWVATAVTPGYRASGPALPVVLRVVRVSLSKRGSGGMTPFRQPPGTMTSRSPARAMSRRAVCTWAGMQRNRSRV
jgi:hypothetical protein